MNLHEYQAKAVFREYGLPVPDGRVVNTPEEAAEATRALGGKAVVKAQVYAGGRGKAGGVKLIESPEEASRFAAELLGKRLVTYQTDSHGQPVNQLLVEQPCGIERELYLGAVIDRSRRRVTFMASGEGGMNIEEVAQKTPEKIYQSAIDPVSGVMPYQGRKLGFMLGLSGDQIKQFTRIVQGLGRLFMEKDLSLLEINPLTITDEGELLCLDGKINIDSNALYRHPELADLHDASQEDPRELRAQEWDLSYVALDGEIGCMVNGAGLAMATMDIIKLHGKEPANFLDVGGTATAERVAEAFKIILSDDKVRGILVNIFGGIVRCDLIAEGIIEAVKVAHVGVPLVVRLEGNRAAEGLTLLEGSGLDLTVAKDLDDAARKVVMAVEEAHA